MPPPRSPIQLGIELTPVVKRLLFVLVGLWLVSSILIRTAKLGVADQAYSLLQLHPDQVMHGRVWQLLSYAWLHDIASLGHIIFNALALVILGPALERRWGGRAFLRFFVLTGFFAGVISVLCGLVAEPLYHQAIVGASGAIFGLIVAWSLTMPNRELLLFFVMPVRVRWLIWIALGLDFVVLALQGHTDTAIQTHIGGAITGWFLVTGNWHPRVFWPRVRRRFRREPKPRVWLN